MCHILSPSSPPLRRRNASLTPYTELSVLKAPKQGTNHILDFNPRIMMYKTQTFYALRKYTHNLFS